MISAMLPSCRALLTALAVAAVAACAGAVPSATPQATTTPTHAVAGVAAPTPTTSSGPTAARSATIVATPARGEPEVPFTIRSNPSPEGAPTRSDVTLAGGDYVLIWKAGKVNGQACRVTIALFRGAEYAGNERGVSTTVGSPMEGTIPYRALPAGVYTVYGYVGCDWEVSLTRAV